ncbi:hypothetical protein A0O34_07105 [Chryseobacterium glaciei]|uniref:Uncharacterized protein n=1 Tax=Chryseobacterium glaciei TaxID=1685010 RepID=A0A172XTF3_9FLAO|nr:hypothetical protein A0O34_07105 [Chryseobacterium glaciei]
MIKIDEIIVFMVKLVLRLSRPDYSNSEIEGIAVFVAGKLLLGLINALVRTNALISACLND